ncbi:tricorn protease [Crossiella equi]|uniref:Tricorn protease homolog n=1 Tax=Crossiella equi TaxID=130796 RepID=A0ABS5ALM4_9PSEU|nr:S41 family peptidase [Crossiella equi]MBP2477470.1 tricorn protease [Crossiella equi]
MGGAGYLTSPSIAGDTVVFRSRDELWAVAATGGAARRVLAGAADGPVLSPDGSLVAYARGGEVHTVSVHSGEVRRLTWLGAASRVCGWAPDGRVLFASDSALPFAAPDYTHIHAVPVDGGEPEALPWGWAWDAAVDPEHGVLLGRHTWYDPVTAGFKGYRGGRKGQLWVADGAEGSGFRPLLDLPASLHSPHWAGGRVYFLSDHEGQGGLYSCAPDGSDLRGHTEPDEYYVRAARSDGTRTVYQQGGRLRLLDLRDGTVRPIRVELPAAPPQRVVVDLAQRLSDASPSPDGRRVVLETRGRVAVVGGPGGARHLGQANGVRYRRPRWLADGRRIAVVGDAPGEDRLELHDVDSGALLRRFDADLGRPAELVAAPAGELVALTNHRLELLVVHCGTGEVRRLDRARWETYTIGMNGGGITGLAWSPDGSWLAYSKPSSFAGRTIVLCEVATGRTVAATRPEFRDFSPAFDPSGRFLYFLSHRVFDPVRDNLMLFEMSFPRTVRPYLIPLRREEFSPFDGATLTPDAPFRVDGDGLADRVVAFPVPEDRYAQLVATTDGVLVLSRPLEGALSEYSAPALREILGGTVSPKATVWHADLAGGFRALGEHVSSVQVSGDGGTTLVRAGNRVGLVATGKPFTGEDWLDLSAELTIDLRAERRQMLDETWRFMREHFWTADLAGVAWESMRERYQPLLELVHTASEFTDLLRELQSEARTSHARVSPVPADGGGPDVGLLGADLRLDTEAGGYRLLGLPRGDSWDTTAAGPLTAPGLNLAPGDLLSEVDGHPAGPPLGALLEGKAGQRVQLTVDRDGQRRTVWVRPLADERALRYREWVRANRRSVHEATGGRIGYIHVPENFGRGFAEFHRAWLTESEKDGLVVDLRFDLGGGIGHLLLEKLARPAYGEFQVRWGEPVRYPFDTLFGSCVFLVNEETGSNAEIMGNSVRVAGLGPLVGKRTWGGVVGNRPRCVLADGTLAMQPEDAFHAPGIGPALENDGVRPDVEVEIPPGAPGDPQLTEAIRLALAQLAPEED